MQVSYATHVPYELSMVIIKQYKFDQFPSQKNKICKITFRPNGYIKCLVAFDFCLPKCPSMFHVGPSSQVRLSLFSMQCCNPMAV